MGMESTANHGPDLLYQVVGNYELMGIVRAAAAVRDPEIGVTRSLAPLGNLASNKPDPPPLFGNADPVVRSNRASVCAAIEPLPGMMSPWQVVWG